jgi:hypothetical protein
VSHGWRFSSGEVLLMVHRFQWFGINGDLSGLNVELPLT